MPRCVSTRTRPSMAIVACCLPVIFFGQSFSCVVVVCTQRAMIVKQGLAAYGEGEVGLGELNAAFAGLGTLCGMVGPLLWGTVYNFFLRAAADSSAAGGGGGSSRWLHLSQGGHFFFTAATMACVFAVLKGADSKTLFLSDEPARLSIRAMTGDEEDGAPSG